MLPEVKSQSAELEMLKGRLEVMEPAAQQPSAAQVVLEWSEKVKPSKRLVAASHHMAGSQLLSCCLHLQKMPRYSQLAVGNQQHFVRFGFGRSSSKRSGVLFTRELLESGPLLAFASYVTHG